jgi:hypothetical protein
VLCAVLSNFACEIVTHTPNCLVNAEEFDTQKVVVCILKFASFLLTL